MKVSPSAHPVFQGFFSLAYPPHAGALFEELQLSADKPLCTLSSKITAFLVQFFFFLLRMVQEPPQHNYLELLLKLPIVGPPPDLLSQNLWGGIQEFTFLTSSLEELLALQKSF